MSLTGRPLRLQFRGAIWAAGGFDGNGADAVRAFFCGGVCGGRSLLHAVGGFDDQEDHEGDDQEVYDGLDEHAPGDDGIPDLRGLFAEVDAAQQNTDERHENVIDERCNDLAEGAANDDCHGKVEHVAAHNEVLEFLEHGVSPFAELRMFINSMAGEGDCQRGRRGQVKVGTKQNGWESCKGQGRGVHGSHYSVINFSGLLSVSDQKQFSRRVFTRFASVKFTRGDDYTA